MNQANKCIQPIHVNPPSNPGIILKHLIQIHRWLVYLQQQQNETV